MNKNKNKNKNTETPGRRCILLVRGHQHREMPNNVEEQVAVLRAYAAEHKLQPIDCIRLPNESADSPALVGVVEDLLRRKSTANDYDVLLVTNLDRLARRGVEHGTGLLNRFLEAGVTVRDRDGNSSSFVHFQHALKFISDVIKKKGSVPGASNNKAARRQRHREGDVRRRKQSVQVRSGPVPQGHGSSGSSAKSKGEP